jgi:DNA-directed RNA polymerase subunit H
MSTPEHNFIPKHQLLSEKEKQSLLESLHISIKELPKILASDSAIEDLDANPGDIIKITRISRSAGSSEYYRVVIAN